MNQHRPSEHPSSAGLPALLVAAVMLAASGCAGSRAGPGEASPATPNGSSPPAAAGLYADLDATVWVQTSAEYRGLASQAYRLARIQLDRALADSSWTAAREQKRPYREKHPAVILDVDETVLDNSPYQARLLRRGESYTPETWDAWVREARAPAIPGALEFTRYAHERGVRVFYVTNRDHYLEEPTRENLVRLGFPVDTAADVALLQGERPGWDDKVDRRAHVARDHRILLLVGDNLHDFTPDAQQARFLREERVDGHAEARERDSSAGESWGDRWIVLPNPVYGSWEDALFPEGRPSDPARRALEKVRRLVPLTPGDTLSM